MAINRGRHRCLLLQSYILFCLHIYLCSQFWITSWQLNKHTNGSLNWMESSVEFNLINWTFYLFDFKYVASGLIGLVVYPVTVRSYLRQDKSHLNTARPTLAERSCGGSLALYAYTPSCLLPSNDQEEIGADIDLSVWPLLFKGGPANLWCCHNQGV